MTELSLSIVIPAYNEADRLPSYLARILTYLDEERIDAEIIVVDDGSRDGTAAVVTEFSRVHDRVRLISLPRNRGKGHAVRTGMLVAAGNLALFADADGATPIEELKRLEKAIAGGADVAIASRAHHDECCTLRVHLHRKVIGTIFNFLVTTLAVPGIRDTQCGFKLFKRDAARAVFARQLIDDFGFDVEVLFLCKKLGYLTAEIPVSWSDVKGSKVSLWRDSLRMFADIFIVRLNEARGAYRA